MKRLHVSVSIRGLLAQSNKYLTDVAPYIIVDDKRLETAQEVRRHLEMELEAGHEYLPTNGCDNFDPQKGCLGHDA